MKAKVKPLNKKEAAWIKRVQKAFNAAPNRFDFVTIGDCDLTIVDKAGAKVSEIYDGAAERDGIVLGRIRTKGNVHAVTG